MYDFGMAENLERKGPSRRGVLTRMVAATITAAAGRRMINQAAAQSNPKDYDKKLKDMRDAAKELYGLDRKSLERKAHFDAFQKIDEEFRKNDAGRPRDSDYRQKLGDSFRVFGNWNTPEGKIFEEYLQEWLKQRQKK